MAFVSAALLVNVLVWVRVRVMVILYVVFELHPLRMEICLQFLT